MTDYTVIKGDTLYAIAKRNNTTVENLVKLNNIKDPNLILIGQKLSLGEVKPQPQKEVVTQEVVKEEPAAKEPETKEISYWSEGSSSIAKGLSYYADGISEVVDDAYVVTKKVGKGAWGGVKGFFSGLFAPFVSAYRGAKEGYNT